jgi:hypothetical protein
VSKLDERFSATMQQSPTKGARTYRWRKAIGKDVGDEVTVHLDD